MNEELKEENIGKLDDIIIDYFPNIKVNEISDILNSIKLTEKESDIYHRRNKGESYRSIGISYSLSGERIRQIEAKIIRSIRRTGEYLGHRTKYDERREGVNDSF